MTNYNVNYTDITVTPIPMQEGTENNTSLDIAIFGNTFLEYGQELNENILHLLENYSCPMNSGNLIGNATPDTHTVNGSYNNLLTHPTQGQLWYNSTLKKLYYWDGTAWRPITTKNDVAANWGIILDGQQLPRPVSATTGYVFPYSECIWSVSPANFSSTFDYMACSTNPLAIVNMKYRTIGSTSLVQGVANYLIIGIKGNTNTGTGFAMTPPVISATPTATPAGITPTPSNSPTVSLTPTPPVTHTQTPIPTGTGQPTPTATPTISHTRTPAAPSASHTRTPAATPSHTPAAITPSHTPAAPTPTASPIHPLTVSSFSPTSARLDGSCGFAGSAGHICTASTGFASVITTGGVPPYTYNWHYVSGSTNFTIANPVSVNCSFRASGATPPVSGGHCDSCVTGESGCPTPDGENVTCTTVQCKITDSVGNTTNGPIFNVVFTFINLS